MIIGRVLKPWSYHGELKIEILTDFPERFASLRTVYVGDDAKPFSVEHARLHGNAVLLKLQGIDSTEAGNKLREQLVQIPTDEQVPLPKGKYYLYQLVGLKVKTTSGLDLGEVVQVLDTAGANDVYVVRDGRREILIPAIEPVVKEIDLGRGEMIIEPLEGLL
ncbi:MAG: 16S rRNA processing protein RimM [Chloroflexi bacterium]|nr:16S rRNA processing protein RimM [Chloroflexota bacterium]